jgi:SAM-dependent methyltransferase
MYNQIVSIGYDKVSEVYRSGNDNVDKYIDWCKRILEWRPNSRTVLDIGCGCGIPVCKYFSERGLQTVGVDISKRQIERAKELAPQATYIRDDYLRTNEDPYDIITAFYSIIHIDRTLHKRVFEKVYNQLSNRGIAVVIVGHEEWDGYEENWLGVEGAKMYWSHYAVDKYHEMLNTMCPGSGHRELFYFGKSSRHRKPNFWNLIWNTAKLVKNTYLLKK